ncbi:MAG: zf-HC2 domain-containing protein [Kofleriaceae bacterium]
MTCSDVRPRLTAYLDGELEGDRGTVVRGHLRTCAACRQIATDEAALRDGLRALTSVDPPASLWAGVQARLAEEEVAESKRSAWRRAVSRWSRVGTQLAPRFAAGGLVAAAVIVVVIWRPWHREDEIANRPQVVDNPSPIVVPQREVTPPAPVQDDVAADLAFDASRVTDSYAAAARELLVETTEVRSSWAADRQAAFDRHVHSLRGAIDQAVDGRPRQKAWRALIRYLQNTSIREDVLAGVMP